MAKIKKGGQSKPIAHNRLSRAWGRPVHSGIETFTFSVEMEQTPNGRARFATLEMDKSEAFDSLKWLATMLAPAHPKAHPMDLTDRRTAPDALRLLADMIENGEKPGWIYR